MSLGFTLVATIGLPFIVPAASLHLVRVLALTAFLLACIGWLLACVPWLQPLRARREGNSFMVVAFVAATGAILAVSLYFLTKPSDVEHQTASIVAAPTTTPPMPIDESKIQIPPGSVVSINQSGGVTARSVTIVGLPPARLSTKVLNKNIPRGVQYRTELSVRLDAAFQVPELVVKAEGQDIEDMDVVRAGIVLVSKEVAKDKTAALIRISGASGDYVVRVITSSPQQLKFSVGR